VNLEEKIRCVFNSTLQEQGKSASTKLEEGSILLESGLDSLGFAILVTKLEDELGYDPFSLSETPYYPRTFGEFLSFYQKHRPKT
jgi:hypothetical protein